jgi:diphthamide synthase (EF-2-diphthine--ammonia ligase)
MTRPRVALSWSSGKDSAWTLHRLRQDPGIEVAALVTTVNAEFNRVAMHAVRQELLHAQAEAAGLPLIEVPIPHPCSNADYETRMRALIERLRGRHRGLASRIGLTADAISKPGFRPPASSMPGQVPPE